MKIHAFLKNLQGLFKTHSTMKTIENKRHTLLLKRQWRHRDVTKSIE